MFNKKKLIYLIPMGLLIINIVYFSLLLSNNELWQVIKLSNLSFESFSDVPGVSILLLPLLSLIISSIGILGTIILKSIYKKQKYADFSLLLLLLTTVTSWFLLFYSQLIASSLSQELYNIKWLSKTNIWISMSILLGFFFIHIFIYCMVNNKIKDDMKNYYKLNKNDEINYDDEQELNIKNNLKPQLKPKYNLPESNDINNYMPVEQSISPNLLTEVDKKQVQTYEQKRYYVNDIQSNIKNATSLTKISSKTLSGLGITEQIKTEYESDFILVQELHRINMSQTDINIARIINLFYKYYERGQDLDTDRIMLSIYRMSLQYQELYPFLKDALIYKLDNKFISKGVRTWFEGYCDNLNNFCKLNKPLFKKYVLDGIALMDKDIKKYLTTISMRNR